MRFKPGTSMGRFKMIRKLGSGGNADVWLVQDGRDSSAMKILKSRQRGERLQRFAREVKIAQLAAQDSDNRVAVIKEVQLEHRPFWYRMEAFDGDSRTLLSRTRGNVPLVASLLLPIVRTLERLSFHNPPILHRDLKPENLLVADLNSSPRLFLSDFGCGFLADEASRATQTGRQVGAQLYRAPEYAHGRVDAVTASGDVFSIGKLLWHYVNGVRNTVFPYTLWFPPEYDLARRFPNATGIHRLNLLIAGCVHHSTTRRPVYSDVASSLELLLVSNASESDNTLAARLAKKEAERAAAIELERSTARSLLVALLDEFEQLHKQLLGSFPNTGIVSSLLLTPAPQLGVEETLRHVIDQGSDAPVWIVNAPRFRGHMRMYPTGQGPASKHSDGPTIMLRLESPAGPKLSYFSVQNGQVMEHRGGTKGVPYDGNAVRRMILGALGEYASAGE